MYQLLCESEDFKSPTNGNLARQFNPGHCPNVRCRHGIAVSKIANDFAGLCLQYIFCNLDTTFLQLGLPVGMDRAFFANSQRRTVKGTGPVFEELEKMRTVMQQLVVIASEIYACLIS